MAQFACEITDEKGKTHYTGVSSFAEEAAIAKGFKTRTVRIDGHCIYSTVNEFAHWSSPSLLRNGPVRIDGAPADLAVVATKAEHDAFMSRLLGHATA